MMAKKKRIAIATAPKSVLRFTVIFDVSSGNSTLPHR
jgi:hypothetical protein